MANRRYNTQTRKMFSKGNKPDYLDFDKDGNKSESMKVALKQKTKTINKVAPTLGFKKTEEYKKKLKEKNKKK